MQELLHVAIVDALLQKLRHIVFFDEAIHRFPVARPVPSVNTPTNRAAGGLYAVGVLLVADFQQLVAYYVELVLKGSYRFFVLLFLLVDSRPDFPVNCHHIING